MLRTCLCRTAPIFALALLWNAGAARSGDFIASDTATLRQAIMDVNAAPTSSTPHTITFTQYMNQLFIQWRFHFVQMFYKSSDASFELENFLFIIPFIK